MTNLIPFDFDGRAVRVVTREGEPWFVLADVCRVLEIANSRDASGRLDDDEKDVAQADTPGGVQKVSIISEAGLYRLVLRSDKPQAKPFQKWVTGTVLPSIRKHGGYISQQETLEPEEILARALLVAQQVIAEKTARLAAAEPKAQALDRIGEADGNFVLSDAAKVLKLNPKRLMTTLAAHGWIFRRHEGGPWVGSQAKVDAGYLLHCVSKFTTSDGNERIKEQVRVTSKGLTKLSVMLTQVEFLKDAEKYQNGIAGNA